MTATTLSMNSVNVNYPISKVEEEIEGYWDILLE